MSGQALHPGFGMVVNGDSLTILAQFCQAIARITAAFYHKNKKGIFALDGTRD